jgi:hypothetical protein
MKEPWVPVSKAFEMVTLLLPKNADLKLDGERTPLPGQHPLATVKKTCAPKSAVSLILILSDDAKETVPFVCDSGREEDSGILRQEIPQAVKLERRSIRTHERLDEIAADRIVIIDQAIPKIAYP